MKIGVIQASSQQSKNSLLFDLTKEAAETSEVINFGCRDDEGETYSYVEISLLVGLLLAGKAVDFVVTGCSSGQGMMLACNSMPGVICGYAPTPPDAFLFGRINDGNAVSVPLGLNFGWLGELNLSYTLKALFDTPFGSGYPPQDAARKVQDTRLLKTINATAKRSMLDLLQQIDEPLRGKILSKRDVIDYVLAHGRDDEIKAWLLAERTGCRRG